MRLLTRLAVVAGAFAVALLSASPVGAKGGRAGELRLLHTRTANDDIELRVSEAPWRAPARYVDSQRLPNSCFANRQLLVGVSSPQVASSVESLWRREDKGEARPVISVVGSRERSPIGVVMFPAPAGAVRATAWFPGNRDDTAAAKDGWFVLAAHLPRGQIPTDGIVTANARVTVRDGDGEVMFKTYAKDLSRARGQAYAPADRPKCATDDEPTTALSALLPEANGPPPVDQAGALAAVTTVYEAAYSGGGDAEKALLNVEDGSTQEVRAAQQAAGARSTQYRGRVTGKVTEVKLLNDHEAAVRFNFILDGNQPLVTGQIGRAVLVDGEWKVARSAYCQVLATSGSGVRC